MKTNTVPVTDHHQIFNAAFSKSHKARLIAKWEVENNRLICKWIVD